VRVVSGAGSANARDAGVWAALHMRMSNAQCVKLPLRRRVVAQAALDARNTRFRQREPGLRSMSEEEAAAAPNTEMEAWDRQRSAAIERLEAAEKVAGSVAKRLPGAVQKVRRQSLAAQTAQLTRRRRCVSKWSVSVLCKWPALSPSGCYVHGMYTAQSGQDFQELDKAAYETSHHVSQTPQGGALGRQAVRRRRRRRCVPGRVCSSARLETGILASSLSPITPLLATPSAGLQAAATNSQGAPASAVILQVWMQAELPTQANKLSL